MTRPVQRGSEQTPSAVAIADAAPIGIFRADANGNIVYINPALERISGVRASRAVGRSWLRSTPRENRADAERDWKAAIAAGEDWDTEFRFIHSDGSTRYASIMMTAEPAEGDEAAGFVGFVQDITQRKNAQAELKRSERLFRLLAENATDIIVRLDLNDHIIYASPAMEEVTGYSAEETVGMNPISWMHPDDAEAAKEESRRLKAGEIEQAIIEYRTPHRKGHYIWAEARSRLVRNSRGEPTEVISVVRDISAHKELEQDLIAAREAEARASAAQSRFLATMSHEIRTPISGLIGMIDLLVSAESEAERMRYRSALAASARTLLRVVDDVLDYSKLSTVGITLEPAPFDVLATVHNVLALYRSAAETKGLTLGLQFDTSGRSAIGDPTRLSQVLGNLLSNAIKFTDQGRVDVEVQETDGRWRFAVADTGRGLSRDEQERLFEPFVQANPSIAGQFGGTGLGLAITRLIVEAMGGTLNVESTLGAGARFTMDVPLERSTGTEPDASPSMKLEAETALSLLVAEDNDVNRLYMTTLLNKLGHVVTAVADGRKAVQAATARNFDAILLDLNMPVLNGDEAARLIRESLGAECPTLIVVSASLAAGLPPLWPFDASLSKPVHPEQLARQLSELHSARKHDGRFDEPGNELATLRALFRTDIARRMAPIAAAIAAQDHKALRDEAHAVQGAATLIGEVEIARGAQAVESATKAGCGPAAHALRMLCAKYLEAN